MEFNVHRLTPSFADNASRHFMAGVGSGFFRTEIPFFRFIPIRPGLVENNECLDIDNVEKIIQQQDRIAVIPCFCRMSAHKRTKSNDCQVTPYPFDICICFGDFVDFFLSQGVARCITQEEALEIVAQCDKNGTSLEVMNTKNFQTLCSCCSCHCGVMQAYRIFGGKGTHAATNYKAHVDVTKCNSCGTCVNRCPNLAIQKEKDGQILFNTDMCLGCGVCVTTCKTGARKLYRKPEEELHYPVSENYIELNLAVYEERKKTHEV